MGAFDAQAAALVGNELPEPLARLAARLERRFHGPLSCARSTDQAWRLGRETLLEGGALLELPAKNPSFEVLGLCLLRLEQKSRKGIRKHQRHHFKNADNDQLAGALELLMETSVAFGNLKDLGLRGHSWLRTCLYNKFVKPLRSKRYKPLPFKFGGWSLCYDLLLLRGLLGAEQLVWEVEQTLENGYGARGKAVIEAAQLCQRMLPEELPEAFENKRLVDMVLVISQQARFDLGKKKR